MPKTTREIQQANMAVNSANTAAANADRELARIVGAFEEGKAAEADLDAALEQYRETHRAQAVAKRERFLAYRAAERVSIPAGAQE